MVDAAQHNIHKTGEKQTMRKLIRSVFLYAVIAGLGSAVAGSSEEIKVERVSFERGKNSATFESSITGYAVIDYVLGARQGQYMNVSMATDNGANYFNILAPGEDQVAMFNGSINGNQFEGILPESGDYKVRVYMMRSAARRNEVAAYRLEMIITAADKEPDAAASSEPPENSAVRAGMGKFDATGQIPCAQAAGQPTGPCDFGVARDGGGTATVIITKPDGVKRAIVVLDGKANSADTSQADGYGEFKAEQENDLHLIRVGEERYEIPDAVITGG